MKDEEEAREEFKSFVEAIGDMNLWDALMEHADKEEVKRIGEKIAAVINEEDALNAFIALTAVLYTIWSNSMNALKREGSE